MTASLQPKASRTSDPPAPAPGHPAARYYEENTGAFLRFGGGAASGSIHRQLWGPGVTTAAAAAGYVNVLLGDAIEDVLAQRSVRPMQRGQADDGRADDSPAESPVGPNHAGAVVLDLGCGVGGTLRALARRFPEISCYGVTISERQAALAARATAGAGLAERCEVVVADFDEMRLEAEADFVVAIESFVHTRSAHRFFETVAAHLSPGGRLYLIDDFVSNARAAGTSGLAAQFRAGWRAPGFCTVRECVAAAAGAGLGLAADRDLSRLIRLGRPRDRVIALVAPMIRLFDSGRTPMLGNLLGGAALHHGLREGVFSYRWLEFVADAA